ncbi:MAG: glycine cleavage T C-terminal barrel domain-containing protein [Pseudomonadota bacterium]
MRRAAKPTPAGLIALEALRIESGAPRPGVDFPSADDAAAGEPVYSPAALGLPHLAPVNRAWFNGRRALAAGGARAERDVCVVDLDAEETSPGASIYAGGVAVGTITSCAWSPRRRRMLAFVTLPPGARARTLEADGVARDAPRVAARIAATAESGLADAFLAVQEKATESPH